MQTITTGGYPIGEVGIARGEALGAALARVGRGQFDRVAGGLAGRPDPDTGIHEARKALKRLRSLLRLARSGLSEERFQADDAALRDLGRALAPLRDARVSIETVDMVAPGVCPLFRSLLVRRHQHEVAEMFGDPAVVERLAEAVAAGRRRWEAVFPGGLPDGFEMVGAGIARTDRLVRKRMACAVQGGRSGDFHEWRKAVKHFRHQMEMLLPLDVGGLARRTARLVRLGELLGAEHDLTVVIGLAELEDGCGEDRGGLLDLLSLRRVEVRGASCALGGEVIGIEPSALMGSLRGVWEATHPGDRAT